MKRVFAFLTETFVPLITVYLKLPLSKVCAKANKLMNKSRIENCNFCFMIFNLRDLYYLKIN